MLYPAIQGELNDIKAGVLDHLAGSRCRTGARLRPQHHDLVDSDGHDLKDLRQMVRVLADSTPFKERPPVVQAPNLTFTANIGLAGSTHQRHSLP